MSDLATLISVLNKSEHSDFVRYLTSRNKRHDVRNIDLFKAVIGGREAILKDELGFNAYNVLAKRVSDRLLDFIASKTLSEEATEEIAIIKMILVARKLFLYDKIKLGFRLITKAEKAAISLRHFTLLNEIYHTMIEYSYLELSPNQEELFKKFESNKAEFIAQQQLNMLYAVVKKAFNDAEFKGDTVDLELLLEENYERFGISDQVAHNFQTLYQLAQIADIAGAYQKKYHAIDLFFVNQISELKGSESDSEKFLLYHIDVLYLVANIYFRKKEFAKSLEFLDEMYLQMQRYKSKFYQERKVQYVTLTALNLNYCGNFQEASEILEGLIQSKMYRVEDLLTALLSRVMIHFQQGELQAAQRIMSRFQHSDLWYERHIGQEWVLNKKYMEILLHIELGNTDLVDSRINSLVRKYEKLFKTENVAYVLPFLKLVKQYEEQPSIAATDEFHAKVEKAIEWKPLQEEDIFLSSFYAWLKAKMEKRDLYEVTIELANANG